MGITQGPLSGSRGLYCRDDFLDGLTHVSFNDWRLIVSSSTLGHSSYVACIYCQCSNANTATESGYLRHDLLRSQREFEVEWLVLVLVTKARAFLADSFHAATECGCLGAFLPVHAATKLWTSRRPFASLSPTPPLLSFITTLSHPYTPLTAGFCIIAKLPCGG